MFKVLDRNDQTNNQYDNDEIILLDNSSNDDDNTIIDEDNGEIDDSNMIFDLDDETFHDSIETYEEFCGESQCTVERFPSQSKE